VTLAETTPVSEAARLQADLRRAQMEPFGWVINSSLAAAGSTDPCLKQRVAAELASRGHRVHLSTTDPAAHIAATLDGQLENLTISRIDPIAETKAYVDHVMSSRGAKLDEAGRALLAEDLRSPCYEEVAVFHGFLQDRRAGTLELRHSRHRSHRAYASPPGHHGLLSPAGRRN